MPLCAARLRCPILLVRLRQIDLIRVFLLVFVDHDVAFVVVAFANLPAENAAQIVRIGDARVGDALSAIG